MRKASENVLSQDKPLISVLLTAYKEPLDFFSQSLESILHQTYDNLEIIIIIDNPHDVSLGDHAQKKMLSDRRIRIVKNDHNLGLALSLNKAIEAARGDYICRMDSDDIASPSRIEEQLNYLIKHHLDLVGGYVDTIDNSGSHLYYVTNIPIDPQKIATALKWNNVVPHPTWFGTREIFRQLYREIPLCEDYDFLLRSTMNGFSIGNCPSIILKYRMSEKSISRSNLYSQYLSQCTLTKQYRQNESATLKDIEKYKQSHFRESKAARYEKANEQFNNSIKLLNSGHVFSGVIRLLVVPAISLSYGNKIRRLLLASSTIVMSSKREL